MVKIRPNGTILLSADMPNRCIDINGENISIGSEGTSAHPAAYGDKTEEVLMDLCVLLNGIGMKAMGNPHTMAIGLDLMMKLPGITKKVSDIASEHVTID